ncbi:hypothetical protein WL1483_1581 [Aeromonas schubertii]|uniref:Uncharacterized protein n=1 Tax=Aeromonas schubertii TaxID=652 RepID=A0A0S2SH06_9GAMM|nr:hypothetical protein WL1483_1581 [Aeromonas schubertii]
MFPIMESLQGTLLGRAQPMETGQECTQIPSPITGCQAHSSAGKGGRSHLRGMECAQGA